MREGLIGPEPAKVGWDGDRLALAWRGRVFDLAREIVRHRDDDGRIEFSVADEATVYERAGPSAQDIRLDAIDFTADEPWTWEDSDFGLFVFHVATGTGPIKFRHAVLPANEAQRPRSTWPPWLDDDGLRRPRTNARSERVRFAELREVRAKFEVAGIWSELTILTLDAPGALALAPITGVGDDAGWVRATLAPRLRALPGWAAANDTALERAVAYACPKSIGPAEGERLEDWAEAPIWARRPLVASATSKRAVLRRGGWNGGREGGGTGSRRHPPGWRAT